MTCLRRSQEYLCALLQLRKPQGHTLSLQTWELVLGSESLIHAHFAIQYHIGWFKTHLVQVTLQPSLFIVSSSSPSPDLSPFHSLLLPRRDISLIQCGLSWTHYEVGGEGEGPNTVIQRLWECPLSLVDPKLTYFIAGSVPKRSPHPVISLCQVSDIISILIMRSLKLREIMWPTQGHVWRKRLWWPEALVWWAASFITLWEYFFGILRYLKNI